MHDLLDGLDVLSIHGDPDVDVRSVVHDSRNVRPGALFACIRGSVTDGHAHAAAAVDAGAIALLVEHDVDVPVPQASVESVRRTLGPLAAKFHGDPSHAMRVLGVTGTNGKTTVTYVLEAIAQAHGDRVGRIGTLGTVIDGVGEPPVHTTPEATELQASFARMRDAGVATVAMEVSSHALDQQRVDGTRFAAVCFTNLSQDHLDFHHTMDDYFAAKARLFTPPFSEHAAIGIGDPYGPVLRDRAIAAGLDVWTYAAADVGTAADITAEDVECTAEHTRFTLVSRRDARRAAVVSTTLLGDFNVTNMLAAAATARAGALPFDAVADGLRAPVQVPGRFERVDDGRDIAVIVDYAHTPDALEHVLAAARVLTRSGGRVAVVYGCGGDRDRAKRPLMGRAAARLADRAYLTSDNPRSEDPAAIAADVLAGVDPDRRPVVELDRRVAIRRALADASRGDVVIIAGKGHEPGQTIGGTTLPFDDREVAREELRDGRCD